MTNNSKPSEASDGDLKNPADSKADSKADSATDSETVTSAAELKNMEVNSVVAKFLDKQVKQKTAAKMLGMSLRTFQRKVHTYRIYGPETLLQVRLRSSHYFHPKEFLEEVVRLYETKYHGIGPLHASELLLENHGIKINRETLRTLLLKEKLWMGQKYQVARRRTRKKKT